jgi:hypothetical protein
MSEQSARRFETTIYFELGSVCDVGNVAVVSCKEGTATNVTESSASSTSS